MERSLFLGIDGCPAGWYVVRAHMSGLITGTVYARFADVLSVVPPECVIAVDIPIGLNAVGARRCDELARRMLAPKRSASVIPAPLRPVLDAACHRDASAMRRGIEGKGMSIQSFAITGKVREVDLALATFPDHQGNVYEVHPEVCFTHLNGGQVMAFAKKSAAGRAERLGMLADRFGEAPARLEHERVKRDVNADDVLDALVALWSAMRIGTGQHASLPATPDHDGLGRRMAIFY
ncbi:MAG: DUF429 domain-containing protein [Polaromonas sp.]|nr:DUF429 domain-containing protein [Gemmatimonadaceae bacterium]